MSFIQVERNTFIGYPFHGLTDHTAAGNDQLAVQLWPKKLTGVVGEKSITNISQWELCPNEYDELDGWAIVDRVEDGAAGIPTLALLYTPSVSPVDSKRLKVSIRFQGVVDTLNISPLGNYCGCA